MPALQTDPASASAVDFGGILSVMKICTIIFFRNTKMIDRRLNIVNSARSSSVADATELPPYCTTTVTLLCHTVYRHRAFGSFTVS